MNFIQKLKVYIKKTFSIELEIKHIRFGLLYTLPIVLMGSLATLFLNFPSTRFTDLLTNIFTSDWKTYLTTLYNGTFRIISIITVIGIAYSILRSDDEVKDSNIDAIIPSIVILGCYFTTTMGLDKIISFTYVGTHGLFYAIVFSSIATRLFLFLYKRRVFRKKYLRQDADLILYQIVRIIEPAFILFFLTGIFNLVKFHIEIGGTLENIYQSILNSVIDNKNIFTYAYSSTIVNNLLWFFGIHGENVMGRFNEAAYTIIENSNPIYFNGNNINLFFKKEFFSSFVYLGGAGSALSLIIAILIKKRSSMELNVSRYSFIMAIFNINELLLYGLPIVINPYFFIPFLITPLVLVTTSFLAIAFNIVPMPTETVLWTTPIIISGFLSTKSIMGSVLQIFNVIVGVLIYMPFVTMYDTHISEESKEAATKVLKELKKIIKEKTNLLITRKDEVGFLSRSLAREIKDALEKNINPMHMEFQPQVDTKGNLIGCEALLRWNHKKYGWIAPPLIIKIAEEAGFSDEIGNWILNKCFEQQSEWIEQGLEGIKMSINLTAMQLHGKELLSKIKFYLDKYKINPSDVEFELTETDAIEQTAEIKAILKDLKDIGSKIAIDDFGMGHSSLIYIKEFDIDVVKIDGSLVSDIEVDWTSQEIVTSITKLCQSLNIKTVAEVVENKEQRNKLLELGCDVFQGYLYSRSLSGSDFKKFYENILSKTNL